MPPLNRKETPKIYIHSHVVNAWEGCLGDVHLIPGSGHFWGEQRFRITIESGFHLFFPLYTSILTEFLQ